VGFVFERWVVILVTKFKIRKDFLALLFQLGLCLCDRIAGFFPWTHDVVGIKTLFAFGAVGEGACHPVFEKFDIT
jgi:hypothetical protein